jgi:hypothetical protein
VLLQVGEGAPIRIRLTAAIFHVPILTRREFGGADFELRRQHRPVGPTSRPSFPKGRPGNRSRGVSLHGGIRFEGLWGRWVRMGFGGSFPGEQVVWFVCVGSEIGFVR